MTKRTIVVITLFLLSSAFKTFGCSCLSPSPKEALGLYPVIFIGKLVSTNIDSNLFAPASWGVYQVKYWTFDVLRYGKGLEKEHSRISILSDCGSNCDYPFETYPVGTEFIIYARRLNEFGSFHFLLTTSCSQTKPLSKVDDKFELEFVMNPHNWKAPDPINPKFLSKLSKSIPAKHESFDNVATWSILLLLLNIGLTAYIIIQRSRTKP